MPSLVAKGVVEVQTGSGLRVASVDASTVHEAMNLFLRMREDIDPARVHEVSVPPEIHVARLAATRAEQPDLEALQAACDSMAYNLRDVELTSLADVEFHRALALATHNPLFLVMLDSIGDA